MKTCSRPGLGALPLALLTIAIALAAVRGALGSPAAAGAIGPNPLAADTIEVASNQLEAASLNFARAIASRTRGDLLELMAEGDVRLRLDGPSRAGISARQAAAALTDFLRRFDGGQAILSRVSSVDGSPDRGFAEILWSGRAVGTSGEVRRTLFLGLMRGGSSWRVYEVRLIR